jgi:hypothetical protein
LSASGKNFFPEALKLSTKYNNPLGLDV